MASGSTDGTIKLWSTKSKVQKDSVKGHRGGVTNVACQPGRRTLASGGAGWGTSALWDPSKGIPSGMSSLAQESPVMGLAFSPDGTRLVEGRANGVVNARGVATGTVATR